MAPVFSQGYYVNQRNDTVKGEIQVNLEDETEFYKKFFFRAAKTGKPRAFDFRRAKAYGFDNRHFVTIEYDGEKSFVERLVDGRLAFYEKLELGKVDGMPSIVSVYYIADTWTQDKDKKMARVSTKFYKKSLKPFMKEEQPVIWDDLDKFTFSENAVMQALNEFNSYYADKAN